MNSEYRCKDLILKYRDIQISDRGRILHCGSSGDRNGLPVHQHQKLAPACWQSRLVSRRCLDSEVGFQPLHELFRREPTEITHASVKWKHAQLTCREQYSLKIVPRARPLPLRVSAGSVVQCRCRAMMSIGQVGKFNSDKRLFQCIQNGWIADLP